MIGVHALARHGDPAALWMHTVLGVAAASMIGALAAWKLRWQHLDARVQATLPLGWGLFLWALAQRGPMADPFAHGGALAFAMLAGWHAALLYRRKEEWEFAAALHLAQLYFVVAILNLWLYRLAMLQGGNETAVTAAVGLIPIAAAVLILCTPFVNLLTRHYRQKYRNEGVGALLAFVALWELSALWKRADGWGRILAGAQRGLMRCKIAGCGSSFAGAQTPGWVSQAEGDGSKLKGIAPSNGDYARARAH